MTLGDDLGADEEVDRPRLHRADQRRRRFRPRQGVAGHHRLARLREEHPRLFRRSEEHTSELQSLMRISYAVFCLKKKNNKNETLRYHHTRHEIKRDKLSKHET